MVCFRALEGARLPHRRRMRCRRYHYQTYLERLQEPICPEKSVQFGPDGAPFRQNVNYPRAPVVASGLVGPHTTPAIVNYKHMTSTL